MEVPEMQTANVKETAHRLIDQLPDNASWRDIVYEIVVRREIELGLSDSEAGRTTAVADVMKEFGIDK